MKYNKGFISMAGMIIAIIVALAVGGGAVYLATKTPNSPLENIEVNNYESQDDQSDTMDTTEMTTEDSNDQNQPPVSQNPKEEMPIPLGDSSCFISPKAGDVWAIGSLQNIILKNPPAYGSHCQNGFSLFDVENNSNVGSLGIPPDTYDQGKQSNPYTITYKISSPISTITCGTGAFDDPAYLNPVTPGKYKIKFYEYDTAYGAGSNSCESGVFTIQ